MSRVIKVSSSGKDRTLLEKGIVLAIRELNNQSSVDSATQDLLAYISLSLIAIGDTIDQSVAAWEKRGYWIKADHYRMEWMWAEKLGKDLKTKILEEDWGNAALLVAQTSQKLNTVKIAQRNRFGSPWVGSYGKLVNLNPARLSSAELNQDK